MSYYLILNNMRVSHANVLTSNYAITPTPLMAAYLFSHALGLAIGSDAIGVAVMHHNAQMLSEQDKQAEFKKPLFQQRRSASYIDKNDYASGTISLSLQPVATAHLRVSLVIEMTTRPDIEGVHQFLDGGRFSGGVIQKVGAVHALDEYDDELTAKLPKNGYWLVDRKDLVDPNDPAGSLIKSLGTQGNGWLTPINVGYALTSEPALDVVGTRSLPDGTFPEHAFAEPLLGLAEYVHERRRDDITPPFWKSQWIGESVFVVTTH